MRRPAARSWTSKRLVPRHAWLMSSLAAAGGLALVLAVTALEPTAVTALANRGGSVSEDVFAALAGPIPRAGETQSERLKPLIEAARRRGATYIVLPALGGTAHSRTVLSADAYFGQLARRHHVRLSTTVLEPAAEGHRDAYYLTAALWNEAGERVFSYRAVMPERLPTDVRVVRGDALAVLESVDTPGRRVGVLAGADLIAGVPRLASRGADTILVSAAFPSSSRSDWRALCERLSRSYRVNLIVAAMDPEASGIYTGHAAPVFAPASGEPFVSARLPRPARAFAADLGLPPVPAPTTYDATMELAGLGRDLFFDPALSRDGSVSCATCHQPGRAFANGEPSAQGVSGRRRPRNVPTLLNVAYKGALFWDGASATLEHQAKFPMSHADEMGFPYLDLARFVARQPRYESRFRALGMSPVSFEEIARALATYERTLVSGASAFDRFFYAGDRSALSAEAQRGLSLFTGRARCAACHTIGASSALLMDQQYHNTGVGYRDGRFSDLGVGALSDATKSGLFLTPSLRNVARTAPYMHDGSLVTLEVVIDFYNRGGVVNPYLDPRIEPLALTPQDREDLVAFLRSLDGTTPIGRYDATEPASGAAHLEPQTFAAIQFTPEPGDVPRATNAVAGLIIHAADQGARFIVLPEHALTGPLTGVYGHRLEAAAVETAHALASLGALAKKLRVWIAVPLLEYDAELNRFYLSMRLIDERGDIAADARKVVPRREFGDGVAERGGVRLLESIETPVGRIGLLSGDDLADAVPRLADRGAGTILVSASWERGDAVDWMMTAIGLARTYRVNLVISNLESATEGSGYTSIVRSDGQVVRPAASSTAFVTSAMLLRDSALPAPALGLPSVPVPTYRPATAASIELGRELFFEPRLSRGGEVACSTCHDPAKAFTDDVKVARGVYGRAGTRNTPTLLNSVYRPFLAWDGLVMSPLDQTARALHGWAEMDVDPRPAVDAISADEHYRERFGQVTGSKTIQPEDLTGVITDYVRTLTSGGSPFDRYYYAQDSSAISGNAKQGFELFRGKAGCAACHQVKPSYALFTDNGFHNTGVGYHPRFQYLGYAGDGLEVNFARFNNFRGEYVTPSLRNIALTAPYMHDGSLATLADVVRFYNTGGVPNPFLDQRVQPLGLTTEEEGFIVEFLKTLNGEHAGGGERTDAAPGSGARREERR